RRRSESLTLRIAREIASHTPTDSPAKAGVQGATDCAVALGPAFAGESGKGYADSRLRLTLCASRQTILLIPDTDEGCHDDRDQADAGPQIRLRGVAAAGGPGGGVPAGGGAGLARGGGEPLQPGGLGGREEVPDEPALAAFLAHQGERPAAARRRRQDDDGAAGRARSLGLVHPRPHPRIGGAGALHPACA